MAACLATLLLLTVGVAAHNSLEDLVCRTLQVRTDDGKIVTSLTQAGDVNVARSLKLGELDVGATIRELQKQNAESGARLTRLETPIQYESVHKVLGTQGIEGGDIAIGKEPRRYHVGHFGNTVLAAWYTPDLSIFELDQFDALDVGFDGSNVYLVAASRKDARRARMGVRIHVLYR